MLNITFNKTKPSQRQYEYSIVGNAQVDVVRFVLQSDICSEYSLSNLGEHFSSYIKVQSAGGEYIDKISATSSYDSEKETLTIDFSLLKKTTQFKNISLQLQFESDEGQVVAQTEIVCLSLKGSIKADKEIPDLFPSVLSQMEHELADHEERIEELEQGGGGGESPIKSVDVSYSNDELNVSLKDKNGQVLMGDRATLPFSSKVDKVEGKGLSTNDLTDLLKNKILNGVESVGTIITSDSSENVYNQILNGSTFSQLKTAKYFVAYIEDDGGMGIGSSSYFGVLYDDHFIELYDLYNFKVFEVSSAQDFGDQFCDCEFSFEKQLTTKEYVDALIQNLREIIAGKVSSYVISYQTVAPTQETFVANKYKRLDGTFIQTWEDFVEYIEGNSFGNGLFNSQASFIDLGANYIITVDDVVIVPNSQLPTGTNIFVLELEVPDRWYNNNDRAYILETTKVDLTDYYTKQQTDTELAKKQATIDSSHKLASDLVDDTNQDHKFVSANEKQTWNAKANESVISDQYDSTKTYAVGDIVIYNNVLYKCSTAITQAEEWNSSHWTATKVSELVADETIVNLDNDLELNNISALIVYRKEFRITKKDNRVCLWIYFSARNESGSSVNAINIKQKSFDVSSEIANSLKDMFGNLISTSDNNKQISTIVQEIYNDGSVITQPMRFYHAGENKVGLYNGSNVSLANDGNLIIKVYTEFVI